MKRISVYIPKTFLASLDRIAKERGTTIAQLMRDAIYAFLKSSGMLFLILMVGCASVPFEGWTKADPARQVTSTALHVADWAQTAEIARDPKYCEAGLAGIVIGEYPEESDVHIYFASTLILQTAISAMLAPKYRAAWQYVWIGTEAATVTHNYSIGLKVSFYGL